MSAPTEVRDVLDSITAAWDAGDAAAFAAPFTDDCTYVVFDGTVLHGRQAVEEVHRFLFDGPLKGSTLTPPPGTPEPEVTLREIAPGVVHVVNATGGVLPAGAADVPAERVSVVSYLLVRADSGWQVAAFQNTRRAPRS
ncbi:SgcJ/EcaC family oxidoreductase [Pseudonocardia ailaonensis]|uniref:SgcJ/EcaC family oxidoreductase n=1 Tax=Pseudonocardia ailaonensis TaxID=367279 RepID=A0ABN2MXD3_9PSEU